MTDPVQVSDPEREAFEKTMRTDWPFALEGQDFDFQEHEDDALPPPQYENEALEMAWFAWQARAALKEAGWISVKERLPDKAEYYLAFAREDSDSEFEVNIVLFNADGTMPWHKSDDVTHWRPLPAPPEEGKS